MSRLCSIKKCKKRLSDGHGLFKIPQKGPKRELWLSYLKEEGVDVVKRKDFHLCGLHFRSEDIFVGKERIKLSPDAFPTVNTLTLNQDKIASDAVTFIQDTEDYDYELSNYNQEINEIICQEIQENLSHNFLLKSPQNDNLIGKCPQELPSSIKTAENALYDPHKLISSLTSKLVASEQENEELKKIANFWREKYENCHAALLSLQKSIGSSFHEDQVKKLTGVPLSKWSDEMISESLAIKLRCGNNGLDYMAKKYPTPSARTVRRRLEAIKFAPGIQSLNLKMLKLKCDPLPDHQKYFQLVFDEKSITPGSYFDKNTKTYMGAATLEPTDAHLKNNPDAIATHVLIFQVVGLTTRFKEVASMEFTAGATKGLALWECLCDVIKACEEITAIKIGSIAMDMNNDNIAMLNAAGVSITSTTQTHFFTHPFDDTRIIYVKPDDIHNIKNMICGFGEKNIVLDNSLVNQFNLTSSIASFTEVQKIYEKQKCSTFKLCPKLTQKVVNPTHFDKMRESVNDEVFSLEVIAAIESENQNEKINSTAFVLKQFNNFHRITTKRGWNVENMQDYEEDMKTLKFLHEEFFMKIKFVDSAGKTTFKRSLYAAIVSIKTLVDLSKFLFDSGSPIVVAAFMLSNSIENLFSLAVAHNKKQNAVQMKDTFKSITLSNHQEELMNFSGSYSLERNQNENENNFLKFILSESEKENANKMQLKKEDSKECTSFFSIPDVIDPLKVFKNALEVRGFEISSEKFLVENCIGGCENCVRILIEPDNKPKIEAKTFLLQLEYAFRIIEKSISPTSDSFSNIFNEFVNYFNFPLHCDSFKSYLQNNFLKMRSKHQQKNLRVPEASRLASRSQI